jgi:hypothetical protein
MYHAMEICLILSVASAAIPAQAGGPPAPAAGPLGLHPDNPHYFLFSGKPTVLVTSGEHYGAVLNLDFDYVRYLDALATDGLNLTRTFSGVYREIPGAFEIKNNPLAPAPNRYLSPWARSGEAGYFDGGNKFDLARWDDAYFARARDFVAQAARRGIVVEFVLFCPMYKDELWKASPMYAGNNVNGVGDLKRDDAHTLKNGRLMEFQLAVTRKIVAELNAFDNLYYEIANEPYFGGITLEWQRKIAEAIVEAEKGLPKKHLIAQNISNGSKKVEDPFEMVSVLNFHYCTPPEAVKMNWDHGRAIGDDETGFKGSADAPYAPDGWEFIMAGGGVYSNLDYSFYPGHEDGSGTPDAPGGGSPALRRSLAALRTFIESFDFVRMAPDPSAVVGIVPAAQEAKDPAPAPSAAKGAKTPAPCTVRALAEKGKQYAVFLRGGAATGLRLALPAGAYKAEWVNIWTGAVEKAEAFDHGGGAKEWRVPPYQEGVALRVKRAEAG